MKSRDRNFTFSTQGKYILFMVPTFPAVAKNRDMEVITTVHPIYNGMPLGKVAQVPQFA